MAAFVMKKVKYNTKQDIVFFILASI